MREIEASEWFAWFPVVLEDGSPTWLRTIWRRKEFIGPRTAHLGDLDLLSWRYYRERPT